MACKYILYITLLSENRHKSSQFKYKHRFKIIANNSYRMYINILVLHGNTCFICAMVKRYGKARMSRTNDSITKVCIGDGLFCTRMTSM